MSSIAAKDRKVLSELAKRFREISEKDEMNTRKKLWRALHDLQPQRPMILFEPFSLEGYLSDYEFQCSDPILKNVETRLIYCIRQYEQLGDDIVIEPYFRIAWWNEGFTVTGKQFGDIRVEEHKAESPSMAYLSNFPVKTPDDLKRLSHRVFKIDRGPSLEMKVKLEDIFKDTLEVRLGNFDNFDPTNGNQPFTGNNFIGITWDVFKLIGAENMMMWAYDHPEALHSLCKFLAQDRKNFYEFMLKEKLLDFNTDNQFAGPSSYGYVSSLPSPGSGKDIIFKDLWCWPESQEAQPFSPAMFNEFFLPYIAEIANMFGLSYYGCCERIDDRFEYISSAIKNLRTVSVSGWSNQEKMGQLLGNKYVYSKKPVPAYVSTETANWDLVEAEAKQTRDATKNGCLEIIFRDAYSLHCTPERARQWVRLWKKIIGIDLKNIAKN